MNKSITRMWAKSASANTTPREGTPPLNGILTPNLTVQAQMEGTESPAQVERQANGEPKLKRRKGEPRKDADRSPPTDISLEKN
jgi:ribosome biogenesis ATPase